MTLVRLRPSFETMQKAWAFADRKAAASQPLCPDSMFFRSRPVREVEIHSNLPPRQAEPSKQKRQARQEASVFDDAPRSSQPPDSQE